MKEFNYLEESKVDPDNLDIECLNQSEIAAKYGKHWAKCSLEFDLADQNVKYIRSVIVKEVDADLKAFGIVKDSVGAREATYRTDSRHIAAKERFIKAQHELNIAVIAKSACGTSRKEMLGNLIQLFHDSYFAGPSIPRNLQEQYALKAEKDRELNRSIKSKRSRNK